MPSQHYSHCPTRYSYSHSRSRDYSPLHRRSSTETSRSDRSSRDSYSREEDSVKETRRTVHRKRVVYSPIPRRNKSQKLQSARRRKEKDDEPISSRTRSKTAAKRGRKNKTSKDVAKLGSTAPRTRRRKATGSAKKSSSARKSRRGVGRDTKGRLRDALGRFTREATNQAKY